MNSPSKNRSLLDQTILIAPSSSTNELSVELEHRGARVIVSPEVEIGPPESYAALDEAFENLYGYDWLIFTNPDSVECFLRRFRERSRQINELDALRVCAIGEPTARELADLRVHVDLIPEHFKAEDIFGSLAAYAGGTENLGRLNFLIPRAASRRDRLAQMLEDIGARVDLVVAYRTSNRSSELTNINALLAGGGIDCVAFTSPASVRGMAALFDTNDLAELLKGVAIACIDEPTVRAAAAFDLPDTILPNDSTMSALAEAIATHCSR